MSNVPKATEERGRTASGRSASGARDAEHERELVRRAQQGDHSAYEDLVRMHQQRLLTVVGGILRRSEDVEDVAQQALVKAYVSLKRFDQRAAFGTWLYKIAVNECWDYFRKKKVRRLVYEADLSEEQIEHLESLPEHTGGALKLGQDAATRTEQRDLLDQLLCELDEHDRSMLVMKEVGGFTVEEIGEALGLNVNTVKVRLFRARAKLVEIYRRRLKHRRTPRSPSVAPEGGRRG
jgi:RNA polymerase sigma-70 factor, ECF subfamily